MIFPHIPEYIFEVIGNPQPGQAAYVVDADTVCAGGIGNTRCGVFSEKEVTEEQAAAIGVPRERLRRVLIRQQIVYFTGPRAGTCDPWWPY